MNQKYTYTGKLKKLPILNFDRNTINLSDYFNEPSYLLEEEINFANRFTSNNHLDFGEENFIELVNCLAKFSKNGSASQTSKVLNLISKCADKLRS